MLSKELNTTLDASFMQFSSWKLTSLDFRRSLIRQVAIQLQSNRDELASQISLDMGKPITQSLAEVDKTIDLCTHYADCSIQQDKGVSISQNSRGEIMYRPLGGVFLIMPWNFPLWQVMRCAVPNLLMGNTILLKHAPIVFETAKMIENIFLLAGFQPNIFTNLMIHESEVEKVVNHRSVTGIAFTGSDRVGRIVAAIAGKALKKCVLELGGSDPFIVCEDADIDLATDIAVRSRMLNTGQTCIAAKRFFVHETIEATFTKKVIQKCQQLKVGMPLDPQTDLGFIAREDLIIQLQKQVEQSISMGAHVLLDGGRVGDTQHFEPMVLKNITNEMPLYNQEIFGPVMSIFTFTDFEDALSKANDSPYGLGATIFTKDETTIKIFKEQIDVGAIAINSMLGSTPFLPFGGVKQSGFGRELGKEGLYEFVNIKSVLY